MNKLRVLWCFQSLPFQKNSIGYGGGGWIASLLKELVNQKDLTIGIAYYGEKQTKNAGKDDVILYSLKNGNLTFTEKIKVLTGDFSGWTREEEEHLTAINNVIEDFKPDIIHIWGTESDFGLIAKQTKIPVVLHLQGLHNPIYNALLPPGFSKSDFIKSKGNSLVNMLLNYRSLRYWEYKCNREIRIFQSCKNYFGRTDFDNRISQLFSPHSTYFYCSELLRGEFMYSHKKWSLHNDQKVIRLISVISSPFYKGLDLILKTALVLKRCSIIKFQWNVVGIYSASFIESKTGIKAADCNVSYIGIKTATEIRDLDLASDIYVHPSYIDNSPNSLCEAQILGLPVITTNVGGVSSIVQNGKTGFLVPSNDPYQLGCSILELYNNPQLMERISKNSIQFAEQRHDVSKIIGDLLDAYRKLIP